MFFEGACAKVVVSGAAGQVGYALLPLIAGGRMLGPNQHLQLNLLDIEPAMKCLEGIRAELMDCAFPLLDRVVITHKPAVAFENVDIAILCGSFPAKPGTLRRDLLQKNAAIFSEHGRLLGELASKDCHVCVVGNPVNTNALVLLNASNGKIKPKNVSALTRLDHNRSLALVAERTNAHVRDVKNCIIWGNHSGTQVPDVNSATVRGVPVREAIKDDAYLDGEFMTTVQQRGYEIIRWRGNSSALSAANAAVDQVHDWVLGTPTGTHVSMAVYSDGNPYGVPPGLVFSFPVTCSGGEWHFVENACITPSVAKHLAATTKELEEERSESLSLAL
ncbi:cytosolic malate dehydrogenase, putative [Trypanosoma cruzi]|uniref:Malate dehydrogenase n=4 Tax=Trypanosoma cruzi TaxID=5693 RepID=V5BI57_TRYCR|nr:cytosolic malate dehydrogenase, putative [Trypanosoma cruzi]ESS64148.1 cytosolic malate dehydrogenase [Trypanosoma cruzi Dm28c]PBJ69650.1 cytosolic malate dehydrogenase [Trypanosoma cruzi cruzi]KAF8282983.1 putative cytosolic malate dehydrogenase [Trypanosoma cruzi]PWU86092.1 putative cytosolic malate dehydrogenase [Trypanosoma cruzi]